MQDIVALSLGLIILAAIINYLRAHKRDRKFSAVDSNKYHAVAIAKTPGACAAATRLFGKRFLSKDAPALPMVDCSLHSTCRCRYLHYDDRRGDDRRFPFGVRRSSEPAVAVRERRRHERRKSADWALN